MTIPRIIHQVWQTPDVPEQWHAFVRSWREHHPQWEYRLWTEADSRAFIKERFPNFLPIYDSYRHTILRADAIRYFVLFAYGGLYVDLDFECMQPFEPLLRDRHFVAGREPAVHGMEAGQERMVANGLMASVPGHRLLAAVIDHLRSTGPSDSWAVDVMRTTGPIMFTRMLDAYGRDAVTILPPEVVYPYRSGNRGLEQLVAGGPPARLIRKWCRDNGVYAVHYWANSWTGDVRAQLHNPVPGDVPGFVFFPGWNSPGYDITNAGRDIPQTARACAANSEAVCFNTDGYIKSVVLPPDEWRPLRAADVNEGLYVKVAHAAGLAEDRRHER